MVDLVVGLAQPAGLSVMVIALTVGVVAARRGEARRRTDQPAGGVAHTESLDEAAATELHRARRYSRPFAVISLTTRRQADVERLASNLRASARVTDVVGMAGRSTIVALLPETAGHEAPHLVRRLADLVDEEVAARAAVGIASFPGDGVTWIGLRASAHHAARPLAAFRTLHEVGELGRSHAPAGSASLGAESTLTAPSAAHVADPAA